MSALDKIAKALIGPRAAPKPQYTPKQWDAELAGRAKAKADSDAALAAFGAEQRAQGVNPMTQFRGPTVTPVEAGRARAERDLRDEIRAPFVERYGEPFFEEPWERAMRAGQ